MARSIAISNLNIYRHIFLPGAQKGPTQTKKENANKKEHIAKQKHRHARRAGVIFFVNKKPLEVANGAYQSIVKP